MKAKLMMFWIALMLSKTLLAQTTETFEASTAGAASFTNGLSTFNLATNGVKFTVVNMTNLGYNETNRFIQVDDTYSQIATITKTSGTFKMNSLWLFVTGNASQNPGVPLTGQGSVTFRGKLANVTKFTVVKNSGFATNYNLPGNGFGLVDFATEGGVNNTGMDIDQLEIQLNANFDYFAIDNFAFSLSVLPITLSSYIAKVEGTHARLTWQTSSETNNKGFEIHRSGDDKQFVKIGEIDGKGTASGYAFADKQPLSGNNYYRLVQVDKDGTPTNIGERTLNFSFSTLGLQVYPNPTTDKITVSFAKERYSVLSVKDNNGKAFWSQSINPHEDNATVDLSSYPKGVYLIQLKGKSENEVQKVIKR